MYAIAASISSRAPTREAHVYSGREPNAREISTFRAVRILRFHVAHRKATRVHRGGTMAEAMIRGLLDRHLVPPSHVFVTGPRRERRAELTKTYNVKALASNAEAAKDAHVVVLSVKPQVLATVMRELRGKLDEKQLVISIVAGATLRALRDGLEHPAIVRAMPNTPPQVGMVVPAWA